VVANAALGAAVGRRCVAVEAVVVFSPSCAPCVDFAGGKCRQNRMVGVTNNRANANAEHSAVSAEVRRTGQ